MVRIKDVAVHAGVSTATVSRVLNGIPVRDDLLEKVNVSIKELSYTPDRTARSLRRRSSDVLALIIPDVENPFFTSLARGVEDVARAAGYSVVLCNTDDLPEQEVTYLRIARDENMAGVIIAPARADVQLDSFVAAGRGVVVLDRGVDAAVDQVKFDNVGLGRRATETLLERGLRRIACITGPENVETASDRAAGWREALSSAGIPVDESLLRYATFRVNGGLNATRELFAGDVVPQAIVATNNLVAVGALRALLELHLDQIVRVSVIGDLPFSTWRAESVDLIPLNSRRMGEAAARMLLEQIQGESTPPRMVVQRTDS